MIETTFNIKICPVCKLEKSIAEFSVHAKNKKDGLQYGCRDCRNKVAQEYRQTARGKEASKKKKLNYMNKFPEKQRVVSKWNYFKIKNNIHVPSGYNFHHWSYDISNFDSVTLLPSWFHRKIHMFLVYSQEDLCYKSIDGILLDTKPKHLKYIDKIRASLTKKEAEESL